MQLPQPCACALLPVVPGRQVSKLYAEVVLLPEARPDENPEDALRGALFHLHTSAELVGGRGQLEGGESGIWMGV